MTMRLKTKLYVFLLGITLSFALAYSLSGAPTVEYSNDVDISFMGFEIGPTFVSPDGTIYGGDTGSGEIYQSKNNGKSWTPIYKLARGASTIRCIFVSGKGTIFASRDYSGVLMRSGNRGKHFETCLTLSDREASVIWRMAENSKGWLFAGEYANRDFNDRCAYIYRSKNDGKDWETIFHDPGARHYHFVAIDPYTDYIYAASGDGPDQQRLIRSIDDGESWETLGDHQINPDIDWQFTSVAFTPHYRIFGEDDPPQSDIVRTSDDVHFEKVLIPKGPKKHNFWSWGRRDDMGNILFGSWTQHNSLGPDVQHKPTRANGVIYLSRDEGKNWKKIVDLGYYRGHSGTHFASNTQDGKWIYIHATGKSIKLSIK